MSTPLLSESRPSGEHSDERASHDEDALLTGESTSRDKFGNHVTQSKWKSIGIFVWAVLATAGVLILGVIWQRSRLDADGWKHAKRNVIFLVSDGMGPTSLEMTRSWRQFENDFGYNNVLVLDEHLVGSSRTRSSNSLVTDSAAGATAFSCGMKSYNGAISILPNQTPCGTVMEAAKRAGYMTGLVVTTRLTDATPACFASHVTTREQEDLIAEQEIGTEHPLGRVVDLMIGGGRCHFVPNTTEGSCRQDSKDIVKDAMDIGWHYVSDRAGFDKLERGNNVKLPLLALVANTDIPYEIDRVNQNDVYPSLLEMASTAVRALSLATKDSEKGFFLMIEGSRIDHAGHDNDPASQVHEVLAFDKTFSAVAQFLENDDTPGVAISTSDHETGGLAAARQLSENAYPSYLWYPSVLAKVSASAGQTARTLASYISSHSPAETRMYLNTTLLPDMIGVKDISEAELDKLIMNAPTVGAVQPVIADVISRRAQIGWSTHGHSGVDVNIYFAPGGKSKKAKSFAAEARELVAGNHENTDIGNALETLLGVDVSTITKELEMEGADGWLGLSIQEGLRLEGLDAYHGGYRHKH
jgi:alkaline phosphatase